MKTYDDDLLQIARDEVNRLHDLNAFMASDTFPKLTRTEKDIYYKRNHLLTSLVQETGKLLEEQHITFTRRPV